MAENEERLRVVFSAVDDGLTKQMDRMMDQAREMERIYEGLAGTQATAMSQMNSNAQKQVQSLQGTANETRKLQDSYTNLSRTQSNEAKRMENVGTRAEVQSAKRMQSTGKSMMKVGGVMTAGLTVPLVGFGKQAVDSSRSYDSGMKDVQKVTDATDSEMAKLGEQVDILSKRWGINSSETLATVEAYAQMGVANEDLAQATEVSTQMQKATNLTAEESALIFGRLSSVMGTSVGDYDRLGSSIVALGNTTGATESEIAHLMERMSGTANVVGVTESELAGLSASMAEAGITAERGGTAMNMTMQQINTAVSEGGAELEGFASVAGTTAQEFASQWADDPMTAIVDFVGGLKELDEQGVDTTAVLKELGITNQGQISVIQALMGNYDGLTQNLETANKGWEENVALSEEANTAMEKQESAVAVLAETWDQLKRRFGDIIENALQPLISALTSVIEWLSGLSDETLTFIAVLGAVVAAAGPVIAILGVLQYVKGTLSMVAIQLNMSMAPLIGTALAIAAAFVGLIAAGIWLVNNWEEIKARAVEIWTSIKEFFSETWQSIVTTAKELWTNLKEWFSTTWTGITENAREIWNGLKEWFSELWLSIKTTVMETWNNIKEFFTVTIPEIVNTVIEWFQQLPERLLEIWNSIITAVVEWATSMWEKAVEAGRGFVERVAEQVGRMPEDFTQLLGMVIGIVIGWVANMIAKAIEVGTEFVGNIVEWFSQLPGRIGEFLSSVWENVTTWASEMISKAIETGTEFYNSISEWFSKLPGRVGSFIDDVWSRVSTWGSNMISKAVETGTNFYNSISEWFSKLPGRVGGFITDVYNRVTTWASNMWNKAKETGSRFLTNIINWFKQLPGRVQTWLSNTLSRVTSWGSDLAARGRQAGQKLVNAVVNAVKSLPGKMITFGKNVVRGFWNGISSLGGWIKGKVSGFFNGIVDGVKSVFKFGSPSKVFEQFGKWIDEGFGKGIEKGSRDAIRPMEKMMDNVISIGENTNIDPLIGVNGPLARANTRINSRVDHNIDQMTTTPQPVNITVNMGDRAYKTFVRDITEEQDREIRLELNYS